MIDGKSQSTSHHNRPCFSDSFYDTCPFKADNCDWDWVCDTLGCGGSSNHADYDELVSC